MSATNTITRLANAKDALVELARDYADCPNAEVWRELCRAKATIDALARYE
jgi:hypothetical protein